MGFRQGDFLCSVFMESPVILGISWIGRLVPFSSPESDKDDCLSGSQSGSNRLLMVPPQCGSSDLMELLDTNSLVSSQYMK